MTRLIDADAIEYHVVWKEPWLPNGSRYAKAVFKDEIDEAQTVDAVPIRRGKWIKIHPQGIYECSECHQNVMTSDIECYRYCHQCGAKMGVEHDS